MIPLALEAAGSFVWRHWKLFVGGAVLLSVLVYVAILKGEARHWQKLDTLHVLQRDAEIAKNAINLRSIGDLRDIIKADNADKDARAKAYTDAKAADARTVAEMDRRYRGTAGRVASLEAISRVPGGSEQCKAPRAVVSALEGL